MPRRSVEELVSGQERFSLFAGPNVTPGEIRGYYIDFRAKAASPEWPPPWFPWPGYHRFIGIAQWGLGCYEHYLGGGGREWLDAAFAAGDHLLHEQETEGAHPGAWLEPREQRHTFHLRSPWTSGMAQGECASLLVRLLQESGDSNYADAARAALGPMRRPARDGGTAADLDGCAFPEEYPTEPPSFVLNGAIFALWGYYDVGVGLGDEHANDDFRQGLDALALNLSRWDTGWWSTYDLYPHKIANVASGFYHSLHIQQLRALLTLATRPELAATLVRFEGYARSPRRRARALLHKAAFRALVSRSHPAPLEQGRAEAAATS